MKTTESESRYSNLETMGTHQIIAGINAEDELVAKAVTAKLDRIGSLIDAAYEKLKSGGRLFYIGSGTSGRLGILDASECPPTFGVEPSVVVGIIAGGDAAIRMAQEGAEDDTAAAWRDLQAHKATPQDFVIGISASGATPYVLGGITACRQNGILTGCLVCNADSPIATVSNYPIEVIVGPEFLTGSTRMKAGTAQKMVLNMISTALMIKLGKVKGNRMVDMQMKNAKLVERGTRMLMEMYGWNKELAGQLLAEKGSVRAVIDAIEAAQK